MASRDLFGKSVQIQTVIILVAKVENKPFVIPPASVKPVISISYSHV